VLGAPVVPVPVAPAAAVTAPHVDSVVPEPVCPAAAAAAAAPHVDHVLDFLLFLSH
jgi:hypothetical protein